MRPDTDALFDELMKLSRADNERQRIFDKVLTFGNAHTPQMGHIQDKVEKRMQGRAAAELFARERKNPNWAHKLIRNKQAIERKSWGRDAAQRPFGDLVKKLRAEGFFNELKKISHEVVKTSAPYSGKGALIGGAIGTGLGGLKAFGNELTERAADDRMGLPDDYKKALRKKRLQGHAATALAWGGAGAGIGSLEGKGKALINRAGRRADRFVDRSLEKAHARADAFSSRSVKKIEDAAQRQLKPVIDTLENGSADIIRKRIARKSMKRYLKESLSSLVNRIRGSKPKKG